MNESSVNFQVHSSSEEISRRQKLIDTFSSSPIPSYELLYSQLGLYLPRQELSRILALADIYRNYILGTHGVIMEFGTCFGRTAALITNLRGIFEPFNFTRRLIIFDTFAGLYGTTSQDGSSTLAKDGVYATPAGYEQYLSDVLAYHESEAPIPHLRKFEIVKGDASQTIIEYFARHPETIVAMAYFDFDIYTPTKACLEAIHPHVVKNSVLVFDELDCPEYPGETRALMETFGLGKCTLRRSPLTPWMSYTTCENIAG